jgi:hypothetical protein
VNPGNILDNLKEIEKHLKKYKSFCPLFLEKISTQLESAIVQKDNAEIIRVTGDIRKCLYGMGSLTDIEISRKSGDLVPNGEEEVSANKLLNQFVWKIIDDLRE